MVATVMGVVAVLVKETLVLLLGILKCKANKRYQQSLFPFYRCLGV